MNEGKSGGWALVGKGSKVAEKVSFLLEGRGLSGLEVLK